MCDESRPTSEKIIAEIADRNGADATELHPPLYEVIDVEALDALFAPDRGLQPCDGRVEFTYGSWRVRVESDGSVAVEPGDES
ncbi:HalOD1 output domain-containing protein [Halorussus salinus]|uniref:HalOD1 output domain-containing protein n=1 Tax=Halorussus salinus TaxID=1364935 RepID=UPI001091E168|nr:HalOD1 output domain-containing protein [Halorussus salinus]